MKAEKNIAQKTQKVATSVQILKQFLLRDIGCLFSMGFLILIPVQCCYLHGS
jgi:hypothetical protein